VDAVDLSGGSALSSLGLKGNYDIKIARMLLSANANPALIDKEGKTALQHLCDRFDDTFQSSDPPDYPKDGVGGINLLLDQVTDINEPGYDAVQIIRIAAVNGWTNVARGLLRAKYQINAIDDFGSTAMQIAAHNGKPDVVRLLLTVEGVDLNLENFDGWTPLRSATDFCHPEIVQMLITAGADPNIHTDGTATALYQAAESGNVEILQMLLDAGADPNLEITSKGGPSRGEAEAGNLEMFKLLLVTGADDRLCQTALHIAAKMGHLDVVEALLAANANVSALNDFGWRASELATEWGHHHVAQVLIAAEGKTQTSSGPFKGFVLTDDWRFREWDEDDEVDMLQKDLQEVSGRIEHDYTTVE
jgi:ankyrin repeat protein